MKNTIKLTENQVNNIVRNSVYRILTEGEMGKDSFWDKIKKHGKKLALGGALAGTYMLNSREDHYDPDSEFYFDKDNGNFIDNYDDYHREHDGYDDEDIEDYDDEDFDNEDNLPSDTMRLRENKKVIRLTESDLHRIVNRCVSRIMRENQEKENAFGDFANGFKNSDRIEKRGNAAHEAGKTIGKGVDKLKKTLRRK